jgi:putative transposase
MSHSINCITITVSASGLNPPTELKINVGFPPLVKLLFMAIAFILINLWIYLLWHFVSHPRPGGRRVFRSIFPLQLMLGFVAHAVERHFPVVSAIYLPLTS